jgi:hypothetical protein
VGLTDAVSGMAPPWRFVQGPSANCRAMR